jgi:hypothetical protein
MDQSFAAKIPTIRTALASLSFSSLRHSGKVGAHCSERAAGFRRVGASKIEELTINSDGKAGVFQMNLSPFFMAILTVALAIKT